MIEFILVGKPIIPLYFIVKDYVSFRKSTT